METYLSRVVKARTVETPSVRTALARTYPLAPELYWVPVCLLLETETFWDTNSPDEPMDVCESDPDLGIQSNMYLELTLPAVVSRIYQDIPTSTGTYLNVAEAEILAPLPFRFALGTTTWLAVTTEYLFTKQRGDGSVRRHAPPSAGGRILYKPKYPVLALPTEPTPAPAADLIPIQAPVCA